MRRPPDASTERPTTGIPGLQPQFGRTTLASAAVAILLLTACGDKPPVVSADTSCERFAHISFSDAQIKAVAADWTLWESAVDAVVAHNVQFDAHCMEVLKEGK